MSLLDGGCGPGTITVDLARSVAPGPVIGMDASAEVIAEATANAAGAYGAVEAEAGSLTFEVGNLFDLRFDDGSFDVVHAHQVLQHVGDPLAALIEMRRVCRSGGIVAARDADYPAMRYFPDDPDLDRAFAAYGALTRVNGANWDVGRKLLHLALEAGFTSVLPSASTWCFATPEDRSWWGELWADRFTLSAVAELPAVGRGSRRLVRCPPRRSGLYGLTAPDGRRSRRPLARPGQFPAQTPGPRRASTRRSGASTIG
jgi:ubiquinone/menaquinone biosynthesis C-methylase UbiE